MCSYNCPRKYREAWHTLLQQHIANGRIRPSSSAFASPSFVIPKADPSALPRWVNDYREINKFTIPENHPLPRINDILADCAKGKIWGKMDMTNSFFQTRVHPDDIHLTAVTTPFGLYEWTVMPIGGRNAPATHQRRMSSALCPYIGKICHVYLDDIIIWSQTIEEHVQNVSLILQALCEASLYCSPKKTSLFLEELNFLGHTISARGLEADGQKVERILDWPTPRSAHDVRSFLELVRYIAVFLPQLAEFTHVLTPLTSLEANKCWPGWDDTSQRAFDAIKQLVVSRECLTIIDHENSSSNKIFVTCDASDWRTGSVLSWGETWETARPVTFDSMQLSGPALNYPVHEKELLAIVRALEVFRTDLLGMPFIVRTNHHTLENFASQRDLSHRQARWQEFLSQYSYKIEYVPGAENTVADALSRLPPDGPMPPPTARIASVSLASRPLDLFVSLFGLAPLTSIPPICSILNISADPTTLTDIRAGYDVDPWCQKLQRNLASIPGATCSDGLLFVGKRLVVPRVPHIREMLFQLAHDALGHFSSDKSYATLRDSYYWPGMRNDIQNGYVPSCPTCQRNKSPTTRPAGPLHPLPIPESRGDSVAIDFIGPLPEDRGFNSIVTMTDRTGADIRIIPTHTNISAEKFAALFFDHWYCDNGLPLEIVSDHDKLFVSAFWRALQRLCGVKLKMSSSFHPQTDSSSERTNKTINQCLHFHVNHQQKGWVRALPLVRFHIMNSVNASTGFSPFQLRMGRSPRLIPPLTPLTTTSTDNNSAKSATQTIQRILADAQEAHDNLLNAKLSQADSANRRRAAEPQFSIGDRVLLSTFHRRRDYQAQDKSRIAKFMPRFDGPYKVIHAHPECSTYTLDLPDNTNTFSTFHASLLRPFHNNNDSAYPSRHLARPGPILSPDGPAEWEIDSIVDERRRGRGLQYLVRWRGWGDEDVHWLPGSELEDCTALDAWIAKKTDPNELVKLTIKIPASAAPPVPTTPPCA
ncbi:hypothetical protein EW146_g7926 [Bondarzewia mesenterica]|uniref:Reverse transcriptase n=1 Tax=Bondarzewia mesenterica TaxID=1095465 RepID=A0A4S4LIB3_9AGAM|nr:hypothetical protein EW146_g7926 [Bondarzewia mesenterica]